MKAAGFCTKKIAPFARSDFRYFQQIALLIFVHGEYPRTNPLIKFFCLLFSERKVSY